MHGRCRETLRRFIETLRGEFSYAPEVVINPGRFVINAERVSRDAANMMDKRVRITDKRHGRSLETARGFPETRRGLHTYAANVSINRQKVSRDFWPSRSPDGPGCGQVVHSSPERERANLLRASATN